MSANPLHEYKFYSLYLLVFIFFEIEMVILRNITDTRISLVRNSVENGGGGL